MIQAIINEREVNVEHLKHKVLIDGKAHVLDLISIDGKYMHLLYNNHSYFIEFLDYNKTTKTYQLGYNGNTYEIGIKDRFDQLLHSMGLDQLKTSKVNDVKAPMPGLVLSIKTSVGAELKKGDPVLILEAMKMENIIKSPSDGIVKNIAVVEKQPIEKNQILITFE